MLTVSLAFAAWYGRRHGKQYALGAGMAVSMLAGTWFEIEVFNTPINVTMATAIVLLIVYCTHSWREIFKAINLLDVLITALFLWHIVVDVYYDGNPLAIAAQAYGQWMLPYAAGRYAFVHAGSLEKLSPVFVTVAAIISVAAIFESVSGINLWELLLTEMDDKVSHPRRRRYDWLYRAAGPVRHPIFLGIVLMTMLPFAVDLVSRQRDSSKKRILVSTGLAAVILGVGATLSRGPILCLPVSALFAVAWYDRIARWSIIILAMIGSLIAIVYADSFLSYLDSSESNRGESHIVEIDDRNSPQIYTSSRNRIFVVKIYGPLVVKGGPVGYGSKRSTGFPPRNLPGLPADPTVRERLGVVDNSYINIGLRFGWIGLVTFVCTLLFTISFALRFALVASTYLYPCDWQCMIAYAGVFFALLFEIGTVFWSYDYAFWIMLQIGAISGSASQVAQARTKGWI
ncbi:hypothetical protein Pla100_55920 [Neorhodopirellula pilleata]|uniref:O-antigen ligase-related domain-containing protein n=2 Tax=Neorhodopirellula pilleata TaxID=2714738 RepID=A0A5C5ZQA3_9BACT|nr:hypothetical protein Pla100_55920 [Neorhodopirellula pilleata]